MRKVLPSALVLIVSLSVAATLPAVAATQEEAPEGESGSQGAPRAMTVDDAMAMVDVGNALISPDGERVFFSRRTLDWEDNEYDTEYFMAPADGSGEPYRYIGEEGGSDFEFSPDGRWLTFKRSVDDEDQLFWMRTDGGEAVQLTDHATSVGSYEWSEDSTRIFFVAEDERPEADQEAIEEGADVIFVDEGPNGQRRDYWSNLWAFDVESEEEEKITDEEFLVGGFAVAPDASKIAFSARRTNRRNDAYKNEIHVVDTTTKLITRLTDNSSPEGGLLWSPDGRLILFAAADDEEWLNRNTKLWLLDPGLEETRLLSGAFEGSIGGAVFTPDGSAVLFNGQQGTDTNVYRMSVETGEVERVTDRTGTVNVGSFTRDRTRFAYEFSDFDTPSDIWVAGVDSSEPVRITEANPGFEERFLLADMELVQWDSVGDYEIEGLLHLPPGYDGETRLPLLLNIHGGPAGVFANSFSARYHIWGGLGWASLSPNVRGSSGYTDHLREGNTVAVGEGIGMGDYQDLINGIERVVERGVADPRRLALRGWSYGGILGGWTITQTDRFQAASIGAGVYDWTSEYGPGFNHDVKLWHIGGTPWDNPEGWRGQSALTHVENVTTPTLLIHGVEDRTDTEQQSMMFFTAIKDIGEAPVRYIKFPREPHGFREPRHQRTRDIEEIRWILDHTLDMEWEPWVRPEEDEPAGKGMGG